MNNQDNTILNCPEKFIKYIRNRYGEISGFLMIVISLVKVICTSDHMFGRAIWDENFEIARVKRGEFLNFQKSRG